MKKEKLGSGFNKYKAELLKHAQNCHTISTHKKISKKTHNTTEKHQNVFFR